MPKILKNIIKLIIGLILIWGGIQYITIYHYGDAVGYTVKPWQKLQPAATMRVLFAGDSTAVGTGASDNTKSTSGWFSQEFPEAHVENHSRNGLRLNGLIDVLYALQGKQFDIAILQIGANDIMHFTSFAGIERDLARVLHLAKHISSKIIILHGCDFTDVEMFLWPLDRIYAQRSLKMRDMYMTASEDNRIAYVDIYTLNKKINDMRPFYSEDTLHLNDQGYHLWYSYIREQL